MTKDGEWNIWNKISEIIIAEIVRNLVKNNPPDPTIIWLLIKKKISETGDVAER
jgi:hypothetical protein